MQPNWRPIGSGRRLRRSRTSVAPNQQINKSGGLVLLPDSVNFDAYRSLFAGGVVTQALFISMFVTIVSTLLSLTVSCLLAYALARPGFSAGRPILLIVLFSMLFSPGIIPMYLVVEWAGLLDSLGTDRADHGQRVQRDRSAGVLLEPAE
jgi:multiple sugar transport system permease protein/putative aldouronate transport system permease protein